MKVLPNESKTVTFASYADDNDIHRYDQCAVNKIKAEIKTAYNNGYRTFYTRLEQGFDLIATQALISMRNNGEFNEPIKVLAYASAPTYKRKLTTIYSAIYDFIVENVDSIKYAGKAHNDRTIALRNQHTYTKLGLVLTYIFYTGNEFFHDTFFSHFCIGKIHTINLKDISSGGIYQF